MATTTIKFDEQTEKLFEELKRDFGATSKAEVIRRALALLEVARQAKKTGREISVTSEGKIEKSVIV
jgi:hypothetical protein